MKIQIKSLTLINFKGIKKSHIDLKKETQIFGANETGKTTHFDALIYLFTGKDSIGKADFDIKTTREDGTVIHNLEHSVKALILADGRDVTLQKIYTEDWTRKKGEVEKGLTGHTTAHFIDTVPVKKKEYTKKVSELIDEKLFSLLSDARFFNEQMHWTERRNILTELCGFIDESQVEGYSLIKQFLGERTIEEQKKVVAAQKKLINEKKKDIPGKIDENYTYITNDVKPNGRLQQGKLRGEQDELRHKITALKNDSGTQDREKKVAEIDNEILKKKNSFDSDKREKLNPIFDKIEALKTKISRVRTPIDELSNQLNGYKNEVVRIETAQDLLRKKWETVDIGTPEIKTHCPTCSQSMPLDSVEKATVNFNLQKSEALETITTEGKELGKRIEEINSVTPDIEKEIKEKQEKIPIWTQGIHNLEAEKEKIESIIVDTSELENQKEGLLEAISNVVPPDTSELEKKIQAIDAEIQEETDLLKRVEDNEKFKNRISELEEEEKKLSQQYADLEKQLFNIETFIINKSSFVESTVNKLFEIAKFKLFHTQVNGGIDDICETMKGGVPYNSVNNAGKIQVGIDIIKVLQKLYGYNLPIWVDNRESITEIPETDCQTISLFVSPKDKSLRVE